MITAEPGFSFTAIKNQFSYFPVHAGSLAAYYQEYRDKIAETVAARPDSYFVLWQLIQNQAYLSIEILEKNLDVEQLRNFCKGKKLIK